MEVRTGTLSFLRARDIGPRTEPMTFNFSNPVGTNPAYYMSITDVPGWLYRMCSWFDLITIWLFVLMGIGFAVVGRKKISTGIAVMAGWFIVMVLVTTGWVAVTS